MTAFTKKWSAQSAAGMNTFIKLVPVFMIAAMQHDMKFTAVSHLPLSDSPEQSMMVFLRTSSSAFPNKI